MLPGGDPPPGSTPETPGSNNPPESPTPENPSPVTRIAIERGDQQTARAGSRVAVAPAVVVTDADRHGIAGVDVTFTVIEGGGHVTNGHVQTNADGMAQVGSWTLGKTGTNRLRATAEGSGIVGNPIIFIATGMKGKPSKGDEHDRLVFRVQPLSEQRDDQLRPTIQVAVVDAEGKTVSQRSGNVELQMAGSGKAQLKGTAQAKLNSGIATFGGLRIDRHGGKYRLRASMSGVTSVESSAFDIIDGHDHHKGHDD